MAAKHHDLVGPMISHMHMVMRLHTTHVGTAWLQYDWRPRREMNAEGVEAWQRWDPWQLPSCLPGASAKEDRPAINTDIPQPAQPTKHQGQPGPGNTHPIPSMGQALTPGGRARRLNRACPLFNKARAGCHYGDECIPAHRCSACKKEDHGRCTRPTRGQESEKPHSHQLTNCQ